MLERMSGNQILPSSLQVALEHHTDDSRVSSLELTANVSGDRNLVKVILQAVAVRAVDHDARLESSFADFTRGRVDARGVKIGRLAAAQNHVAVVVASGADNRAVTALGDG